MARVRCERMVFASSHHASIAVLTFVEESCWFEVVPWPDDEFVIYRKAEGMLLPAHVFAIVTDHIFVEREISP